MEIKKAWYRISAKALIYNENWEFLLCKEDNWTWDIPGWWLDHWESCEECIIRELQEEMWLEVVEISTTPKYFITAHKPKSKTRPWLANIFYEVKVKNFDFTPSEECVEIWFFNQESIKDINTIVNVNEFVKQL
jgi:ADP-ribose pyrophosphatase YjhB (NUDIX family)